MANGNITFPEGIKNFNVYKNGEQKVGGFGGDNL